MRKSTLLLIALILCSCKDSTPIVSIEDVEQRIIATREVIDSARVQFYYDDEGVKALPLPLVDDTTALVNYKYETTNVPNQVYETFRVNDSTTVQIFQCGWEYFVMVYKVGFTNVGKQVSDQELYLRARPILNQVSDRMTAFGDWVREGLDTLDVVVKKENYIDVFFDFEEPIADFTYKVMISQIDRWEDAACIEIVYSIGPL